MRPCPPNGDINVTKSFHVKTVRFLFVMFNQLVRLIILTHFLFSRLSIRLEVLMSTAKFQEWTKRHMLTVYTKSVY